MRSPTRGAIRLTLGGVDEGVQVHVAEDDGGQQRDGGGADGGLVVGLGGAGDVEIVAAGRRANAAGLSSAVGMA